MNYGIVNPGGMNDVAQILADYPRIDFACRARRRRDPRSRTQISERLGSILDRLDQKEPVRLRELAQRLGVTAPTMCLAVARLEALRFVVRRRDDHDRRKIRLRLTASGVRMKAASSLLEPDRVRILLGRLKPAQRRAAVAGLRLLALAADL